MSKDNGKKLLLFLNFSVQRKTCINIHIVGNRHRGKLYNWDWVLVLGPNKSGTQQKWDPAQRQMTKLGPSLIKVGLSLIIVGPCQKSGTLSEKWDPVGKVGPC